LQFPFNPFFWRHFSIVGCHRFSILII
jgi:hypothetical protein